MRYASFAFMAFGIAALGYFQLVGTESMQIRPDAEALPILFAGATITMGLLMLMFSKELSIHSPV